MSFFKAYDMRGTYGTDFDLNTIYRVGKALPGVIAKANGEDFSGATRILVGRDCRITSESVRNALVAGLRRGGAEVFDIGPATTPMVYFYTAEGGFDGSVMITASHNPPGDNGLKVSRRGALPVGYDSGLSEVERIAAADDSVCEEECEPVEEQSSPLRQYVEWLKAHSGFDVSEMSSLDFAVDCSDGMASILVHELFPNAKFLNDKPDGNFPHHAPNPLLAESREQLAKTVRENKLDFGVIFDGDADRCMFVDEKGEFIQPDYLIPVLAKTFNEKTPIIYDVRTSRAAIEAIRELGCEPVIGKVGHAFAKKLLREVKGVCGGEFAGHYYFRDFHGCDSGELAALRIIGAFLAAKNAGKSVSEFMSPVCGKYANSGELNFKAENKDAVIESVLIEAAKFGTEIGRCEIDGVRLDFPEGWLSIRRSNTEPYLRLLVECDTHERLKDWLIRLESKIDLLANKKRT